MNEWLNKWFMNAIQDLVDVETKRNIIAIGTDRAIYHILRTHLPTRDQLFILFNTNRDVKYEVQATRGWSKVSPLGKDNEYFVNDKEAMLIKNHPATSDGIREISKLREDTEDLRSQGWVRVLAGVKYEYRHVKQNRMSAKRPKKQKKRK
jgi:hypothetical protein